MRTEGRENRCTTLWKTILLFVAVFPLLCTNASSALYEVGPGHPFEDLGAIDWPNLVAGDEVRIHWRAEPYRSKIGLHTRATADAPLRIVGVAGPDGSLPVISGKGAATPPSLNGFFDTGEWPTEVLGVITIIRGENDDWEHKPAHIEIEGLHIEGGHPDYSFTGMNGSTLAYNQGAAGIHVNAVEHLTVRNCEITDNANGVLLLSRGSEERMSRDILFEENYVHDNGVAGSDQEHNIYTQASGIVFQYNRIGALRSGAGGGALKDRSADTVIRYNWIVSGARTLDLVEPEDSWEIMLDEPGFGDTWVYGNVIINEYSADRAYALNMIHYGGDMGEFFNYRKGTLHFFHNTVYVRMNRSDEWDVTLFDLSTNDETVVLRNNIFYREGDSYLYLARDAGTLIMESNNWISSGWENSSPETEYHTFAGTVTVNAAPVEGSDPGLANPAGHDFAVRAGGAAHDAAADLPLTVISTHPLDDQYVLHQDHMPRSMDGSASDLGAFELGGGQGTGGGGEPANVDPVPDVTANSGDGPVSTSASAPLSIKVALDSGTHAGASADWWLVLVAPDGLRSFSLANGWVPGLAPTYQGALFDLPPIEVSNISGFAAGSYAVYFGVDLAQNGTLDLPVYYDGVTFDVTAEGEGGGSTGGGSEGEGFVTYSSNGRVYRIRAASGAGPEDITALLDQLAPGTGDRQLISSPNGDWMVVDTERFDAECNGWSCIALVNRDVTSGGVIRAGGTLVRSEGRAAVDSTGTALCFTSEEGPHSRDVWVTRRSGSLWGDPALLSAGSPYAFNSVPVISDDGSKVLFECGDDPFYEKGICEVGTDGGGFRVLVPATAGVNTWSPDYTPGGDVVFEHETEEEGETIYVVTPGSSTSTMINGVFRNDNSPCVLPDGRIASLWLQRPGNTENYHELKVMDADGGNDFMLLQDVEIGDIGLGCGR